MSNWNDLSYEEKQAKARRADEVLKECGWLFDEVVAVWTDSIVNSPANAADKREEAYRHIRATNYLREHLAGYANTMALERAAAEKRKE